MKSQSARFLRQEWLQILLVGVPFVVALVAMPFVPERVPMQWNLRGEVNWYAPKSWGLMMMPVSMVLTYALLFWMEKRDPSRHRESDGGLTAHGKATRFIRLALSGVMAGALVLQVVWSLGYRPDVSRWVVTATALLLAVIGNLFGKLKPNKYVGIRVPWTLNSAHVWRQTHRVAGWVWMSSSLIMAALCWVLSFEVLMPTVGGGWLVLIVGVPLVVAWWEARVEKRRTGQG